MKYQFKGEYPEVFIDLGRELQPNETFESEKAINHPRLQVVNEPKATSKAEKAEVSE